ncbi:hypothetical protein CTA2_504 [Colletotrichum tanaceti]|uniref:Uncharacterized protein n=1 Tax=Colletotrichum tanaceti TaxID=1306861 RepID=A0A4U6XPP2_9PEZI|nr:hypothetical protein CTA2_504 [Colletotrichum tanaceti]TKW57732.1 hypothetical protein CTA1_9162 [Colletotrichum tanaceti]
MRRFNDHLRQCFAKIVRSTGVKKRNTEVNDTKVEAKVDAKVHDEAGAKINTEFTCHTCCQSLKAAPKHKLSVAAKKGWNYRPDTEFPWRLEQVVEEEENWRGTWVLEVKDLQAMDWGTACVSKANGTGGQYQRQPTRHLPFVPDRDGYRETLAAGGQDDLMVQLGKR